MRTIANVLLVPILLLLGAAPASAGAVLRASPSAGLTDGAAVTVSGTGFPTSTDIGIGECLASMSGTSWCDTTAHTVVRSSSNGTFETALAVREVISTAEGTFDCATDECWIGAAALNGTGDSTHVAIAFGSTATTTTAPPRDEPSVTLSATDGLVSGDVVGVQASGFTPRILVNVLECPPAWNGGYGCSVAPPEQIADDGSLSATFTVARLLSNTMSGEVVDCAATTVPCTVGVLMAQSPWNEYAKQNISMRLRAGYWMLGAAGTMYSFGEAPSLGSPPPLDATDVAATPSGDGYWITSRTGAVNAFGDAPFLGGDPVLFPGETVSSISSTRFGAGYWLFTSRGRVFPYGSARFVGDLTDTVLNGPVIDSVATPNGDGYYMVGSDGGIFTFGDARFAGSMGGVRLNEPVVGLAPDPDGHGYWLVASDGGIFAFDAPFRGSMGGVRLNRPVVGLVAYGDGYLMVGSDGGIFSFSSSPFLGSLGSSPPATPIVAVAPLPG